MPPRTKNSKATSKKTKATRKPKAVPLAPSPTTNPAGRPSLLTPEKATRICELIRAGNYVEVAAASTGIHRASLFRWLKAGAQIRAQMAEDPTYEPRGHDRDLVSFCDSVEAAQADAEIHATVQIAKSKDWRAHAFRLERRFKVRWARDAAENPLGGADVDDDAGDPIEALARELDAMAQRRGQTKRPAKGEPDGDDGDDD